MGVKNDLKNNEALTVFADPTSAQLYVKLITGSANEALASVVDMQGHIIIERSIPANQITFLPLNNISEGIYIARVKCNDKILTEQFRYQ